MLQSAWALEHRINMSETLYRVCTSEFNATLPGSVFEGKEPLYPVAEAPLDNLTLIYFLRQEARDNEGYIAVDTSPRGTCIQGEVPAPLT